MSDHASFEELVLPHLDAAYNLARWLARDAHDAEDVVQDACIRALRYVGSLHGNDARAWFLTIVRNAFYDWLGRNRPAEIVHEDDDAIAARSILRRPIPSTKRCGAPNCTRCRTRSRRCRLQYREVLVLRELEEHVVQGNRAGCRHTDRHRHVAPRAGARVAAAIAGAAGDRRTVIGSER